MLMLVWVICCSPFCSSVISEKAEATHRWLASFIGSHSEQPPLAFHFHLNGSIRHYFPSRGRTNWTAAGAALRESHPSEVLSELLPLLDPQRKKRGLWLSRGTIVCGQGHRKTACQCCFWSGWTRSSPYLPSFMEQAAPQVVFAHPTASLFHISGLPAEVIQSPDIHFSRCSGR